MMPRDLIGPNLRALDYFSRKTISADASLNSMYADLPAAAHHTHFIVPGVTDTRQLEFMRGLILRALSLDTTTGPLVTRTTFIRDMRRLLGAVGLGDSGDLRDLTSRRRLALIYDMAVCEARGYANYERDIMGPGRDTFPAQELVITATNDLSVDWFGRWEKCGGIFPSGERRLVALKADPIWARISRFGLPWPPFDCDIGVQLIDLSHEEAIRLGILSAQADHHPRHSIIPRHS